MRIEPAIFWTMADCARNRPTAVALAPAATKTTVKPNTNASEATITWRRDAAADASPCISSSVSPEMNEM